MACDKWQLTCDFLISRSSRAWANLEEWFEVSLSVCRISKLGVWMGSYFMKPCTDVWTTWTFASTHIAGHVHALQTHRCLKVRRSSPLSKIQTPHLAIQFGSCIMTAGKNTTAFSNDGREELTILLLWLLRTVNIGNVAPLWFRIKSCENKNHFMGWLSGCLCWKSQIAKVKSFRGHFEYGSRKQTDKSNLDHGNYCAERCIGASKLSLILPDSAKQ